MNVLITDDSSFMRKILRNILEDMEFDNIWEADDGNEAVEMCEEKHPDLVLLDIVMESMDGIDALEEIQEMDADVDVIMISAVGQQQMMTKALDKGADAFIKKPFENDKVRETVNDVINE